MFKNASNETVQSHKNASAHQINPPRLVNNQTEIQIPINNETEKTYALAQTASDMFDPNLSSPPNEFISKLRLRMDVYFAKKSALAE